MRARERERESEREREREKEPTTGQAISSQTASVDKERKMNEPENASRRAQKSYYICYTYVNKFTFGL